MLCDAVCAPDSSAGAIGPATAAATAAAIPPPTPSCDLAAGLNKQSSRAYTNAPHIAMGHEGPLRRPVPDSP